jgi:hypothetical protein
MARVGRRIGIGSIAKDIFVHGFRNVDRPRAKERLVTISRAGGRADRGKWPWWLEGQN